MKDENRICDKHTYHCAICGKTYYSVQERMSCEMACLKTQKEAEKKAAEEKKKKEQKVRKTEVDEALKNFTKLAESYTKDYGPYVIDGSLIPGSLWPNKNRFFF